VYFVLYVFVLYFVLYFYFLAPATRDRSGGRKRDGASCLGCTLGTWLCSMSNSIIYHVSCYRFVSQHTGYAIKRGEAPRIWDNAVSFKGYSAELTG
jgi:hypothetical protein